MAPDLGRIGPYYLRSYTLLLDLAILLGLALLAWHGRRAGERPADWVDAGLSALAAGVLGGRLGHVMIYRDYFAEHPDRILQVWRGGLDWHGAILAGLIGLAIGCRWRRLRFRAVADALALALPLGALLTYTGCLMGSCGHGREVASLAQYPAPLVLELPDLYGVRAPRLASQLYGLAWSAVILALSLAQARREGRPGVRLWIALALLSAGAFAVGFTRGDSIPMLGALRLDQVLDLAMAAVALAGLLLAGRRTPTYTLYGPAGFVRR